jgi:hypothetical protein
MAHEQVSDDSSDRQQRINSARRSGHPISPRRSVFLRPSSAPGRQFDIRAHQQLVTQVKQAITSATERIELSEQPDRVRASVQLLERVLDDLHRQADEAKAAATLAYTSRYHSVREAQVAKEDALRSAGEQRLARADTAIKDDRQSLEALHRHRAERYTMRAAHCATVLEAQQVARDERGKVEEQRREARLKHQNEQLEIRARELGQIARQRHEHQQEVLSEVHARNEQQHAVKMAAFEQHRLIAAQRLEQLAIDRAKKAELRNRRSEAGVVESASNQPRPSNAESGPSSMQVANYHPRATSRAPASATFESRQRKQEAAEAEAAQRIEGLRKDREGAAEFHAIKRQHRETTVAARLDAITDKRLASHEKLTEAQRRHEALVESAKKKRREEMEASARRHEDAILRHLAKAEEHLRFKTLAARSANVRRLEERADQLIAQTLQGYTDFTEASPTQQHRDSRTGPRDSVTEM